MSYRDKLALAQLAAGFVIERMLPDHLRDAINTLVGANNFGQIKKGQIRVPEKTIELLLQERLIGTLDDLSLTIVDRGFVVEGYHRPAGTNIAVRFEANEQRWYPRGLFGTLRLSHEPLKIDLQGNFLVRLIGSFGLSLADGLMGFEKAKVKAMQEIQGVEVAGKLITCHIDDLPQVADKLAIRIAGYGVGDLITVSDLRFVPGEVLLDVTPVGPLATLLRLKK